ncbi:phosphoglycolate phosphatase/pyrophosphatase PpaX [Cytobacillus eiseniae]|uniref:Phosphoglycolate phosphatase/pyrophosphatase PpaX n=1 Tax=Cytobacillus eiseniae TaxID=762947 RepID=A0ABS4RLH0_9BACI|nr:HAD family hydrolase [Cytobacillus eiseniae]MBP2243281.1 phosphoglycolate phosphatase/pyrophosphatase PpaX [Cytobacillus eiseniae]
MIKAIIFDFDGTLADTLPVCFYAFQAVFKEFDHIEVTADEIKAMFGPFETGIIRENLNNSNHDEAIELYYEKYREQHEELVLESEEINKLLQLLKREGYQLGIVTGKATRSLLISLECLKMNDLFDVIITGDDVIKPKPHPEGVRKALDLLHIKNNEAIFLGDSDADILAGKQANVHTIGVQWLPNYQTLEFSVQPDQMFNSVDEFIQVLKMDLHQQ